MEENKRFRICLYVILGVLIIDQVSKIWIKTHMSLYLEIDIFSWFKIYFVENPGMAFGMELGSQSADGTHWGKLFLSLFRIVAIGFIGYFLIKLIKKLQFRLGYLVCISLIWAGAFGNIIDSVFYGEIFTASNLNQVAEFTSFGSGYSSWLHGKVVDMLQFPLFEGNFPSWFPIYGGEHFLFFSPIFNIADSAITIGIFILLIFYRKDFSLSIDSNKKNK